MKLVAAELELDERSCFIVRLNGETMQHVTACDDEEGWVERVARDPEGGFLLRDNQLVIERIHGAVAIIRRADV